MIREHVSVVTDIEQALFSHWSQFGLRSRGELHDDDGLLWFSTPIAHLPYNGVIRTHLRDGEAADRAIAAMIDRFRAAGVEFVWFEHPSATPSDLGERLAAHGLQPAERITCMSLDLAGWAPPRLPSDVVVREVCDDADARTYSDLTIAYWEIPEHEREPVAELHRGWIAGRRYIAFVGDRAVGKAYLSLVGPPGVAAVFGMNVQPEARRRGIATALTTTLLQAAREHGRHRVVLHSTPMAVELYRRAGFVERCGLTIFATRPLWSASS